MPSLYTGDPDNSHTHACTRPLQHNLLVTVLPIAAFLRIRGFISTDSDGKT